MKYIILVFLLMIAVVGCSDNYGPGAVAAEYIPCPANQSPSVFLYPATNIESESPEYFNNTQYEIIRNDEYIGKLKASKRNESYFNFSNGDHLELLISAESDDCYVLNEVIQFRDDDCLSIYYFTPELRCAKDFAFNFYGEDGFIMSGEDGYDKVFTTYRLDTYIKFQTITRDRFEIIGCSYDYNLIDDYHVYGKNIQSTPDYVFMEYNIYDGLYDLGEQKEYREDYELIFELKEYPIEPFNTTIICTFFDKEWFIGRYAIEFYISDREEKDVGQPNPSFNFTLEFKP